jgi:hypothetical protein
MSGWYPSGYIIGGVYFNNGLSIILQILMAKCHGKNRYHSLESQSLFWLTYILFIPLNKCCYRWCYLGILCNIVSVTTAKPNELLYFEYVIQFPILCLLFITPIPYCYHYIWIHGYSLNRYDSIQALHSVILLFAYFWLQITPRFQHTLYNPLYIFRMFHI